VIPKFGFSPGKGVFVTRDRLSELGECWRPDGAPEHLCIEVVNLSDFAVTISEVGVGRIDRIRQSIFQPTLTNGKTLPCRLEAREEMTALADPQLRIDTMLITRAVTYAQTECGKVRYGSSPIFKKYVKSLRQSRPSHNHA
jgi:hypothetical protein